MNRHSIAAKVSIFFAIFVLLILGIAFGSFRANQSHQEREFFKRMHDNTEFLQTTPKENEDITAKESQLKLLSQLKTKNIAETLSPEKNNMPPPPMRKFEKQDRPMPPNALGDVKRYKYEGKNVFVIERNGRQIAVQDNSSNAVFYAYFFTILSAVLLGVYLLYAAIMKSLRPLKELEIEIEAFGLGVKPAAKNIYAQNEIGNIQKAFHETSAKISGLLDAREIFLKNAAHELKTPIAKGVIVAHMLDEQKQQTRLLDIFSSMMQIIEGIMTAEEVMAKGFSPKIEPILLRGFCEKIRKKLLFDTDELFLQVDSTAIVMADPRLLEIALSNLFENGVKFRMEGSSAKCSFECGKICIKNSGEPLETPIDKYFEPFFKETSIRNQTGTGLGLYLVKKVLEIQGLGLDYRFEDGVNIFAIG